jgi:hypothetical protein
MEIREGTPWILMLKAPVSSARTNCSGGSGARTSDAMPRARAARKLD